MSESDKAIAPVVSVIVPTYNRRASLQRLLGSLSTQSISSNEYEVIVVDDGSTEDSQDFQGIKYPFTIQWILQKNQGATSARNNGALLSKGAVLVFIDDDITISETALQALANVCLSESKVIALGVPQPRAVDPSSWFCRIAVAAEAGDIAKHATLNGVTRVEECNTQILAIRKTDFHEIGMFQDPTGGWPNWDDVDFGFRATQAGYRMIRVTEAAGDHWDRSLASLRSATQRWYRASVSAVRLFQRYPELKDHIIMFSDMIPIDWHSDPLKNILRKIIRKFSSFRLILYTQSKFFSLIEKYYPSEPMMRRMYQFITGGYKYRGFHQGLKEYGPLPTATKHTTVINDVPESLSN